MRRSTPGLFSIILAAVLVAPLSGCAIGADEAAGQARRLPTAPERLAAAAGKLDGQSLAFKLPDDDGDSTGVFDPASRGTRLTMTYKGEPVEAIGLPDELYIKTKDTEGKYIRIVVSKLPADSELLFAHNPLVTLAMVPAITEAQRDPDGTFRGYLDLGKVTAPDAVRFAGNLAKAAADRAARVPFTATVAADGRLATLTVRFPGGDASGKDAAIVLEILEVGPAQTVAAPPRANVIDAPPEIYK